MQPKELPEKVENRFVERGASMNNPILRAVSLADGKPISELIVMAIEDLADQFTKATEKEDLVIRLRMLLEVPETRFSAAYGLVIEDNGKVAGVGFAYPGNIMRALTQNMLNHMKTIGVNYHVDEESRLVASKEANEDEFYIDNLAVFEAYRGKGYSRMIIEAFEERAKAEGFSKISILADLHNPKAKAIYERLGYVSDSVFRVLGHDYDHLVKPL